MKAAQQSWIHHHHTHHLACNVEDWYLIAVKLISLAQQNPLQNYYKLGNEIF